MNANAIAARPKRNLMDEIGQIAADMLDLRNKVSELRDHLSPVMSIPLPSDGPSKSMTEPSKPDSEKTLYERMNDVKTDMRSCDRILIDIFDRLEL